MRIGGFKGFSFRAIAADVGVKSASVHYHFPTKEKLAATVVRRYTDEVAEIIDRELATDPNERMCPCAGLGAGSLDLPPEVMTEVRRFFRMCLDKIVAEGPLCKNSAAQLLATNNPASW
jgi:TetR/AcrR family transcriptional repressor of nem operon